MRSLFLCFIYLGVASCGSENDLEGIFEIAVVPNQMAVVPTPRRSCADIYSGILENKSIAEASVGFSSFQLLWKDTSRDLFIVRIQLDLEATVLATKVEITDPDELGTIFGIGDGNDVKIPRFGGSGASTTGFYQSNLKDLDGDSVMDTGQLSCPLAFGGMSLPENTEMTIGGFVRILAIAQADNGDQEVLRLAFPVKLIIVTD